MLRSLKLSLLGLGLLVAPAVMRADIVEPEPVKDPSAVQTLVLQGQEYNYWLRAGIVAALMQGALSKWYTGDRLVAPLLGGVGALMGVGLVADMWNTTQVVAVRNVKEVYDSTPLIKSSSREVLHPAFKAACGQAWQEVKDMAVRAYPGILWMLAGIGVGTTLHGVAQATRA